MTPPDARQVAEQIAQAIEEAIWTPRDGFDWELDKVAAIIAREFARLTALLADADERAHYSHGVAELAMKHRDAAEAALATAEAEARRQVWEDTSAEVDQILERYPNDTEALAVLVEWLRQRARPSEQTETSQ